MPYETQISILKFESDELDKAKTSLDNYKNDILEDNNTFKNHNYSNSQFLGQNYEKYIEKIEAISSSIESSVGSGMGPNRVSSAGSSFIGPIPESSTGSSFIGPIPGPSTGSSFIGPIPGPRGGSVHAANLSAIAKKKSEILAEIERLEILQALHDASHS